MGLADNKKEQKAPRSIFYLSADVPMISFQPFDLHLAAPEINYFTNLDSTSTRQSISSFVLNA